MISEKRKLKRYEITQFVELSFPGERFIGASGLNISKGGILCKTEKLLEQQTQVFFILIFPINNKKVEISCEGIVSWAAKEKDGFKAGIEFLFIKDDDKKKLIEFVDSMEK